MVLQATDKVEETTEVVLLIMAARAVMVDQDMVLQAMARAVETTVEAVQAMEAGQEAMILVITVPPLMETKVITTDLPAQATEIRADMAHPTMVDHRITGSVAETTAAHPTTEVARVDTLAALVLQAMEAKVVMAAIQVQTQISVARVGMADPATAASTVRRKVVAVITDTANMVVVCLRAGVEHLRTWVADVIVANRYSACLL